MTTIDLFTIIYIYNHIYIYKYIYIPYINANYIYQETDAQASWQQFSVCIGVASVSRCVIPCVHRTILEVLLKWMNSCRFQKRKHRPAGHNYVQIIL